jgi:hypothetical protein
MITMIIDHPCSSKNGALNTSSQKTMMIESPPLPKAKPMTSSIDLQAYRRPLLPAFVPKVMLVDQQVLEEMTMWSRCMIARWPV